MEESPPPVLPKDESLLNSNSRPPTAASASKRKRDTQDYDFRSGRLDAVDLEGQTPKRSRSQFGISDNDVSTDDTPLQKRSVRRKKGTRNLSAINMRHAASTQAINQRYDSPTRESRFQEGSLTDKPSEQPPSVFMNLPQSNSGNLSYREELMEDYQEGMPTPRDSLEAALQYEKDTRDERVAEIAARQQKEEHGGIFRFGKSLASNFHPVTLWNRIWNEQKDELTRQNMLEAERKAKAKAEAEAKYAEMKTSGQLGLQPVAFGTSRDSGIAFDNSSSYQLKPQPAAGEITKHETSELPESATKTPFLRSVRSRLHMRKPSFQSLRALGRMPSQANLRDQTDEESSSSLSPIKSAEFHEHALLKSASKYDMKRQQKLTKRVSDLEAKLNKARSELDDALVLASPAPQLGSKYQRFVPSGTIRKPRFVPGALPTLHSEGLLNAQQLSQNGDRQSGQLRARTRIPVDLSTAFDIDEEEETVKAPRERAYPTRAQEVFKRPDESDQQAPKTRTADDGQHGMSVREVEVAGGEAESTQAENNKMDWSGEDNVAESATPADQDTMVDGPDANTKNDNKKAPKAKRRSLRSADERLFKPDVDADDDAEWDEAIQQSNKKKKRGMPANSPPDTKATTKKAKTGQRKTLKQTATSSTIATDSDVQTTRIVETEKRLLSVTDLNGSEDELAKANSRRTSVASEDVTLEPVYEEEEETTTVPLKDAPSKPTAKATPARYGYNAVRSRSSSPQKRVEPGTEERMMARAGNAARSKRSTSADGQGRLKADTQDLNAGLDRTTKRAIGHVSNTKENFEWPDDVF